ncbi:hypothetical protein L596_021170 [Steinernema carpocapsae]|uniref:Uncharacterized protein n=1 Tax=Steinernema carpocapsae TaxID=34508 RepID=A0A4V6A141_STECR|nr:hypothetical protein L596_021170 [Steinernema carpocapsae]
MNHNPNKVQDVLQVAMVNAVPGNVHQFVITFEDRQRPFINLCALSQESAKFVETLRKTLIELGCLEKDYFNEKWPALQLIIKQPEDVKGEKKRTAMFRM